LKKSGAKNFDRFAVDSYEVRIEHSEAVKNSFCFFFFQEKEGLRGERN